MTASGFARSLAHVLVYEGGKVDDPRDPGGRTNQGVIQRVYDAYRALHSLPRRDVYLMEDTERDEIYRKQYWDAVRGDDLPDGVDFSTFDGGVNSGPGESIVWLQRALGSLYTGRIDGILGMGTLAALRSVNDYDALISRMEAERLQFLRSLKNWSVFGNGWASRVKQVLATGQAWATGSVGPAPTYSPAGSAKAPSEPIPTTTAKQPPMTLLSALAAILQAIIAIFTRKQ